MNTKTKKSAIKKLKKLSEKELVANLKNWNNLTEAEKDLIINQLENNYLDERKICENALNYFWFLNENHINRFNSTVNDSISIQDYLDECAYNEELENWEGDLEELIKEFEEYYEREIALNLCYELEQSIEEIKNSLE